MASSESEERVSRFNQYYANHFASCTLLAHARDVHRERDVRIYLVPGYTDVVGVTDTVDCWIAPVVQGAKFFHSVDIWQMLRDMQDGKPLPKPQPLQGRRRVAMDDEVETPVQRRRAALDEQEPEQSPRRRRVSI